MTLKKVADLANVSIATVSLVINGFEGSRVSASTKNRVLKAIKELNYKPNLIAQRLVLRKTNTIGLFIPFTSPIFRNYTIIEMVGGIQDATNERNLDLLLFSSGKEILKVDPFDHILKQTSIDGLIILNTRYTSYDFNNQLIHHLRERNLNFVIVHYYWGNEKIKYVGVDYEKDVFKSVSYLTSIGHKKIGLITGLPKALVTSRIIKGYQRALRKINIKIQNSLIASADYDPNLAYDVTQRLINENSSLTAIFVADYEMAFSSLKAIKDLKKKVPKDISLISYVDHELFPFLDPPLSSVKLPYYEIGKKAVELLLDDKEKEKRVIFDTELILRSSAAPV